MPEYNSLFQLVEQNDSVKKYYRALPEHVRSQIDQQANEINSATTFMSYVEQYLRSE